MNDEDFEHANGSSTAASGWWRDVGTCMQFLSVYPLGNYDGTGDGLSSDTTRAFGLAGALLGAISCIALFATVWIGFSALLCAILVVGVQIKQTGALHEDGLADVADGFGGGMTRERKLEIMRDSRIGTYGVVALIITIGIRVGCLAALVAAMPVLAVAAAIVAVSVLSRAAMGKMMSDLAHARNDGRSVEAGRPDAAAMRQLLVSSAVVALPLLAWSGGLLVGLLVLAGGWLAHMVMKTKAQRHIGGQTGDVLGANQQVCEVVMLLVLAGLAV